MSHLFREILPLCGSPRPARVVLGAGRDDCRWGDLPARIRLAIAVLNARHLSPGTICLVLGQVMRDIWRAPSGQPAEKPGPRAVRRQTRVASFPEWQ